MRLNKRYLACTLVFFSAIALYAFDPVALTVSRSGELTFLDATQGIFRVSSGRSRALGSGFYSFQALDMTSDGDSLYVTLVARKQSAGAFSRLVRWDSYGKQTGEWSLGRVSATLAGVVVDSARQLVYCTDSRQGSIYELDPRNPRRGFVVIASVRDVGSLGPLAFDAKRRRLLVADIQQGKIYSVTLNDRKVSVLVDRGTIIEPSAVAFDAATDRLYVTDSAKRCIWRVDANGKVTQLVKTDSLRYPAGLALASGGKMLWIADRDGRGTLVQFDAEGRKLSSIRL